MTTVEQVSAPIILVHCDRQVLDMKDSCVRCHLAGAWSKGRIVVWDRSGEYRIVPPDVVENTLTVGISDSRIFWSQCPHRLPSYFPSVLSQDPDEFQ
jgi:hypothetical protein